MVDDIYQNPLIDLTGFVQMDTDGKQKIIFTQDGKRVYYTADDGESFEEIY